MKDFFSIAIDYVQERRWLGHVLFWLSILFIQTFTANSEYGYFDVVIQHKLIMLLPKMIAAYTLIYYQIPKLLYKKRYLVFLISFILTSYLYTAFARFLVVHVVEELFRVPPFEQETILEIFSDLKKLYFSFYLAVYFPAIIIFILKTVKEKNEKRSQLEVLEKEKFSAELNFLKAQIHPHFLFNTLNNLYVLTLQKSEKAPTTVLKLSEMLDYILYQCNDRLVTIEKETVLIQNYIELEKLRYGDRLELEYEENIDNKNVLIAPLVLISIIENAFKHGASGAIDTPTIKISIEVKNQQLSFHVYNTKARIEQKDETNYKHGIGLKNTKKQLELLYPDRHTIEIKEEDVSYSVKLDVDLSL